MKLQDIQDIAAEMISANSEKLKMFSGIDDIRHSRWQLPEKMRGIDWIQKSQKDDLAQAFKAAVQILSTVEPKIHFRPLRQNEETRERAEMIERALKWHLTQAAKRNSANLVRDIVTSVLAYDEIAAQVVYMPYQKKLLGGIKSVQKWSDGSKFTIVIHNPKNVFVERSPYGVHSVLLRQNMKVRQFRQYWGELAKKSAIDDDTEEVTIYDYTDETWRYVWAYPTTEGIFAEADADNAIKLIAEEHKLPFIAWVVRAGGSGIDEEPEYQREPMLAGVWRTGGHDLMNILQTMKATSAISHWAFPRTKTTTPDGHAPEISYDRMAGNVALQTGEDIEPMQPPPIDPNILQLAQEMDSAVSGSTIPKVLLDANPGAGAAFATVNAVFQAAGSRLDPAKRLAEYALSDALTQMLQWIIFTKDALYAYDFSGRKKDGYGEQILIPSDTLDPENIYVDVQLTAHAPEDMLAKVNQAQMMVNNLGFSKEDAYEMLDIEDYGEIEKRRASEMINEALLQAHLQEIQQAIQLKAEQASMQMQQQAQTPPPSPLQNAQTQASNRAMAGMNPAQQMSAMGGLTEIAQGQMGFDPAMGGTPPAMVAPSVTREMVNRTDANGLPLGGA